MNVQHIPLKPGVIIKMRNRLWRVDNIYNNELTVTSLDGGEVNQRHFYLPFEKIEVQKHSMLAPDDIGRYASNKLIVQANRLNLINSTAPFLLLQRSRIIPNQYQFVPLIISLLLKHISIH